MSKKQRKPCKDCPWRKSTRLEDIPRITDDLRLSLYDEIKSDGSIKVMACHKSNEGEDFPCAGFMTQIGNDSIGVRLLQVWSIDSPDNYSNEGCDLFETLEGALLREGE
jgi:hypothetical protein